MLQVPHWFQHITFSYLTSITIVVLLQWKWDVIVANLGTDPYTYRVLFSQGLMTLLYFSIGIMFTIMDLTLSPKALRKYKTQVGANEPLDMNKFWKMIKQVIFNVVFLSLVVSSIMYFMDVYMNGKESFENIRAKPSLYTILWQFPIFSIMEEFIFYYSHSMLHHKYLYKRIHKKHHEWIAPVALAAGYAHPVEYVVSNLATIGIPPMLFKSHVIIQIAWYSHVVVNTLIEHSGYHLPFLQSSEYHDYHHLKFDQNFGTFNLLDYLNGTDKKWRGSGGTFERHRILLGSKSARELYPIENEKTK